jgi:Bacterial Ig-like domain (group 2)
MRLVRIWLAVALALPATGCGRKPTTVDVSPKKLKIYGVDNTQRLTARILDKKGLPVEQGTISWSSSKADVAAVDSSGRVTAKGSGKTMIVARFQKLETQVPVEVIDVKGIDITPLTVQLMGPPGTQFPLQGVARNSKGKPVEIGMQWTSSKPSVATVDSRGVVSSVATGSATVVAKLGDLQAGCDVRVSVRDLVRLQLHPETAIVRPGDVQKFEVLAYGPDGKPIEGISTLFQSSDPSVARVDPQGSVTGVAAGTATIRATLGALTAEATLIVN